MSRTDKTKPIWVRIAEHGPVEDHDHRHGICDLPASPYDEGKLSWSDHYCRWTYPPATVAGCCFGCRCGLCDPDKVSRRRRARREGKRAATDGQSERDELAIGKERWPPPGKRKDTKRWCKGKRGREHVPELRWSHLAQYRLTHPALKLCSSSTWFSSGWLCYHEIVCTGCGKILVHHLTKEQCPTWLTRTSRPAETNTRS